METIRLYKYRPFNDYLERIITTQKIWFPTRARLNDVEDLQITLISDVDAETYRQYMLMRADQESWSRNLLKRNLRSGFTGKGRLSAAAKLKIAGLQKGLQKYLDGLGILSLSSDNDSPLLWARYGDCNKGVCITFTMELSEYLLRVKYETQRPRLRRSQLMLRSRPDARAEILKVLSTKTAKWSGESEWRYFLKSGNAEFPFLGTIESIRLGKKMADANREKILQWVKKSEATILIED